ncbi:hypothetical protein [uncultured Massilia sp.]|uniref:hypothetical protein n=1 Tax=uncultured Massilia sp. TaxID=169973 RepID=UPI0025DE9DB0|nr:hypothetical protein [uncultured Massilia sp.]
MSVTFQTQTVDAVWGCAYQQVVDSPGLPNVKLCFVEVTNLPAFAAVITRGVLDKSWITSLDPIVQKAYDRTVTQTANKLVSIFQATSATGTLGADFGELMVSMGSAYALEKIFSHLRIPIAELWKPKLSQNEGFDFHTTCPANMVNFGEAKYSSNTNSYTLAISQAEDFIDDEKHFRDAVHLMHLVDGNCVTNLDNQQFGIVAAFSIQGKNPDKIFANAAKSAATLAAKNKVTNIYLVGVR